MTTVAFMSDLHIDSNNFGKDELETLITLFKDKKIQHLHIAGDIANGFEKTSQEFLDQLQCHLPVTFSLGNHDMLGLSEEAMRPFEFQKIPFSNHTLLAFSGWYDYSFVPTISPQNLSKPKIYFGLTDASNEWDLIQPLPNVCCKSSKQNSCKWINP